MIGGERESARGSRSNIGVFKPALAPPVESAWRPCGRALGPWTAGRCRRSAGSRCPPAFARPPTALAHVPALRFSDLEVGGGRRVRVGADRISACSSRRWRPPTALAHVPTLRVSELVGGWLVAARDRLRFRLRAPV